MGADKTDAWAFAEQFVAEGPALLAARARARDLAAPAPSPGSATLLRVMAGALRARAVVEIGSSCGVTGLAVLETMPMSGVFTIVDGESELLKASRAALAEAGYPAGRSRLINSHPLEVLPRLADGGYDLAVTYAGFPDAPEHVEAAIRLLRPGGVLALTSAMWRDQVPDPARRDEHTTQARVLGRRLHDDERLATAMLPTGDGIVLAVRR